MTDSEFLSALEDTTLPAAQFGHLGHVRAAYLYLRGADFPTAVARICASIQRYATALGQPGRYDELLTVAYTALIKQHMHSRGTAGGWEEFIAANTDLMNKALLEQFRPQSGATDGA